MPRIHSWVREISWLGAVGWRGEVRVPTVLRPQGSWDDLEGHVGTVRQVVDLGSEVGKECEAIERRDGFQGDAILRRSHNEWGIDAQELSRLESKTPRMNDRSGTSRAMNSLRCWRRSRSSDGSLARSSGSSIAGPVKVRWGKSIAAEMPSNARVLIAGHELVKQPWSCGAARARPMQDTGHGLTGARAG